MFIGSAFKCTQFCEEEAKGPFDRYHSKDRHTIYDMHDFKHDNRQFIRKSKRAWSGFSANLQSFFKKLKKEIQFIQNQAMSRLQFQEVKTAINTGSKELTKITYDIMQERYRNLTCQDIYDFIKLRRDRMHEPLKNNSREKDDFADQIIQQVKGCFRDICDQFRGRGGYQKQTDVGKRPVKEKERERERDREREREPRKKNEPERRRVYEEDRDDERPLKGVNPKIKQKIEEKRHEFRQRDEEPTSYKKPKQKNQKPYNRKLYQESEQQQKKPCPILKLSDINGSSKDFAVDLKLLSFIKPLHNRQIWRVVDETGEVHLVIPYHKYLKEGVKIHLNDCYAKQFNRTIQIHTKYETTISGPDLKKDNLRVTNQGRKGRPNQKEGPKERGLSKIQSIDPESQDIKFIVKVLKATHVVGSERRFKYIFGDETGIVNAQFDGFESMLKEGHIVYIRGADAEVDEKGHIFMTGDKVLMEPAHDSIPSINVEKNISSAEYVAI